MSVLERIQTMETLWGSLTHEATEIKSPEWYGKVLSSRKNEIKDGSAKFKSLAEVKSNL